MSHDGPPAGTGRPDAAAATDPEDLAAGVTEAGEWFGIGNEFTGVRVRKVWTRNGERLELHVPARNHRILLDAMQLEIVAAQDPSAFTRLFQRQLGSDESDAAL
ncbi:MULTISPECIES: hypothetical protein [unclassified Geodermatophilus]|uniref:hypothetical protein n=1 Tax=unclassified Geodermatophilus TaxID=2637632 RepID=UPI003EEB29AD